MWSGCSHLSFSVPRLRGENGYSLRLEDLRRAALLFVRLDSSYCTRFLASAKLRKLAVYSGAEAFSGETLICGIFPELSFYFAILLVTLAKGMAKHW